MRRSSILITDHSIFVLLKESAHMTSEQNALNKEVHTKVFGNPFDSAWIKDYARDCSLVSEMIKQDYSFELDHDEEGWKARFYKYVVHYPFDQYSGTTMSEAVCQAAVHACTDSYQTLLRNPRFEPGQKVTTYSSYAIMRAFKASIMSDETLKKISEEWQKNPLGTVKWKDPYEEVAKDIFNTEAPSKEERSAGKAVAFGAMYGLAAYTAHIKNDVNEYLKPGIRHGEGYTDYLYAMKWVPHNHQQNQIVTDDKVQANPIQNSIVKSILCTYPWMHSWETYQGLNDKFDYCTKCDDYDITVYTL